MDEVGALWIPNHYYWQGRFGLKAKYIIVHGTAGGSSAQGVASWLDRANAPVGEQSSVHYIIGQNGEIVQTVNELDSAWGNGYLSTGHDAFWNDSINPNMLTISIEHVKSTEDNSAPLTAAQQASSFRLINHICERHGIPKKLADATGGITGHFSIDPVNRSRCPGNYPWLALWAYLKPTETPIVAKPIIVAPPVVAKPVAPPAWLVGALSPEEVAGDFDILNGNHWRSKKTGKIMQDAILAFYRKFGGDAHYGLTYLGHPLTDEIELGEGVVMQRYATSYVTYNVTKDRIAPPGAGSVYLLPLDDPHVVDATDLAALHGIIDQDSLHIETLTKTNNEQAAALVLAQSKVQSYQGIVQALKPFADALLKA